MKVRAFVAGAVAGLLLAVGVLISKTLLAPAPSCFVLQEPIRIGAKGLLDAQTQVILKGPQHGFTRVGLEGVELARCPKQVLRPVELGLDNQP